MFNGQFHVSNSTVMFNVHVAKCQFKLRSGESQVEVGLKGSAFKMRLGYRKNIYLLQLISVLLMVVFVLLYVVKNKKKT